MDLKVWECGIPGKEKTMWEGGMFKMTMTFPDGMLSDPGTLSHALPPTMPLRH